MACLFPWFKKDDPTTPLPCGRCPECLKKTTNDWVFRVMQEYNSVETVSAHFLTLTYDEFSVPITANGMMTLRRDDVQRFMKNLRRLHSTKKYLNSERGFNRPPIRVFGCGEYGSRFKRPHYHVILFNADEELISRAWMNRNDSELAGYSLGDVWMSPGDFSSDVVAYTCGYMFKPRTAGKFDRDDRLREFRFMSMGLGKQYLTDDNIAYHKADLNRAFITLPGGIKSSMPRYYRERIFTEEERDLQSALIEDTNKERARVSLLEFANSSGSEENLLVRYHQHVNSARRAAVKLFHSRATKRND